MQSMTWLNFLRDNSARSCHWEVLYMKGVCLFFLEKGIIVTLKIYLKTVPVVRFSTKWRAFAFSQLWKLNFFHGRNVYFSMQEILLGLALIVANSPELWVPSWQAEVSLFCCFVRKKSSSPATFILE